MNLKLMKGNDAVVYGALLAGAQAYFGYPISPLVISSRSSGSCRKGHSPASSASHDTRYRCIRVHDYRKEPVV